MFNLSMIVLFVLTTAIPTFGQQIRLVEGQWGNFVSPKTVNKARAMSGRAASEVTTSLPNDPLVPLQASLSGIGMTKLWSRLGLSASLQSVDVPVVYIDGGVDCTNPDLVGRVNLEQSRNFIEPGKTPCSDEIKHGTPAVSIGHGTGNNSYGISGLNWSGTVIVLKVIGATTDEFGRTQLITDLGAIVNALKYVKELGEQYPLVVVNASFIVQGSPKVLDDALADLENDNRAFVVAAADNFSIDAAATGLPCIASRRANVICVGSLSDTGVLSAWSAYGDSVTYTGRGENQVAEYPDGRFAYYTGNSGTAPQISTAASLAAAKYASETGRSLSASELRELMKLGAGFAPGLMSAIPRYSISVPATLDVDRLFCVTERKIQQEADEATDTTIKPTALKEKMSAEKLVDGDGNPIVSIAPGTYNVYGSGFDGNTVAYLNGIRLEVNLVSDTQLEITVGPEATFFSGYNNVLYLAETDEDGEVLPFTVVKVASVFEITQSLGQ